MPEAHNGTRRSCLGISTHCDGVFPESAEKWLISCPNLATLALERLSAVSQWGNTHQPLWSVFLLALSILSWNCAHNSASIGIFWSYRFSKSQFLRDPSQKVLCARFPGNCLFKGIFIYKAWNGLIDGTSHTKLFRGSLLREPRAQTFLQGSPPKNLCARGSLGIAFSREFDMNFHLQGHFGPYRWNLAHKTFWEGSLKNWLLENL
jgi:hypothetical protein